LLSASASASAFAPDTLGWGAFASGHLRLRAPKPRGPFVSWHRRLGATSRQGA
jgi:hypothetical protein